MLFELLYGVTGLLFHTVCVMQIWISLDADNVMYSDLPFPAGVQYVSVSTECGGFTYSVVKWDFREFM